MYVLDSEVHTEKGAKAANMQHIHALHADQNKSHWING